MAAAGVSTSKKAESVQVIIRCRPMNKTETKNGCKRIVKMDVERGQIEVTNPKARHDEPPKSFTFDSIYDWNSCQQDLYDETFSSLVESVLQGYNGTIFAYGQTGTGKTWTMEGDRSVPELRGVIPNSFKHIFDHINRSTDEEYLVRASYLEIYQEQIRDLLSKDQEDRLSLREKPDTGVYVKDLKAFVAKNADEIERVMTIGNKNRSVGCTDMNEHSSRSHAIFIITVECCKTGVDGEQHIHVGKLNLVDLAGSERQSKTHAVGERLKEATKINQSLSTLGNVISALVDGRSSHIPYRDSKLTRLLQDSLGGNARTVMVATMGPADYNYDESITTLRYANRAKNIQNKPKINEDPKDALIREYQDEIQKLQEELKKRGTKTPSRPKKKKKHRNADGELVEGESEEEDGEEEEEEEGESASGNDMAARLKEKEEEIEAEKRAILDNKEMIAEEKDKLMHKLQKRSKQVAKEQDRIQKLSKTIEAMQGKLLVGDKTIHAHTEDQERALELQRRQLAEEKRRERELQQHLEAKEESAAEVQDTFTSLQQEVNAKTKKLNALYGKFQNAQQELEDLESGFAADRLDLMQTMEALTRDIRLKDLILENFVPDDVRQRFVSRAEWSDDLDKWMLADLKEDPTENILPRPMGTAQGRNTRTSIAAGNTRYRPENPLSLELDMPSRTTRDYEGPTVAPRIQSALDAALDEGAQDIVLDAKAITAAAPAEPGLQGLKSGRKSKAGKKKHTAPADAVQKLYTHSKLAEGLEAHHRAPKNRRDTGVKKVSAKSSKLGKTPRGSSKAKSAAEEYPEARGLVPRYG